MYSGESGKEAERRTDELTAIVNHKDTRIFPEKIEVKKREEYKSKWEHTLQLRVQNVLEIIYT